MGLREWVYRKLDRGDPPAEPDPEALVEVEVVPLAQGPLLLSYLEGAGMDADGIEATGIEGFHPGIGDYGARTYLRIFVRHADAPRAVELIEQYWRDVHRT